MPAYLLKRLVRRSSRPVPITTIQEVRLKDGLQNQQGRRLYYPVPHRRYSQRPQLSILFADVYAPYPFTPVALGSQGFLDSIQESLHSRFRRFDLFYRSEERRVGKGCTPRCRP